MFEIEKKEEKRQIRLFRAALWAAVILLLLLRLAVTASAETYYGTAGDGVTWVFDVETAELRILGERGAASPTWDIFSDEIRTVSVGEGITTLPERAFAGYGNLTSVSLPASLAEIGTGAFEGCVKLSYVDYAGTSSAWRALLGSARTSGGNDRLLTITPHFHLPVYHITVHYKADDGTTVLPQRDYLVTRGDSMEIGSPVFEGYETDKPSLSVRGVEEDETFVVVYSRRKSRLTLHYRDTDGVTLLPDRTIALPFGESITLVAPEIEGYVSEASEYALTVRAAETEQTFLYVPETFTLTIRHIDETGREILPPTVIPGIRYGEDAHPVLPVIEGYTAMQDGIVSENLRADRTLDAIYKVTMCAVTLNFEDGAGNPVGESKTLWVRYGDAFLWSGSLPEGYELSGEVSVARVTEDTVLPVVLNPIGYPLTVRHETADGVCLREEIFSYAAGEEYRCEAIFSEGYAAEELPENAAGIMPSGALTVVIRYRAVGTDGQGDGSGDGRDPEKTPDQPESDPSDADGTSEPEKSLLSDRTDDTRGESGDQTLFPWGSGDVTGVLRLVLWIVGGAALCALIVLITVTKIRRKADRES